MIAGGQDPSVRPRSDAPPSRAVAVSAHREAGALRASRYRLAEFVGRGATASVWRARGELLDRDVAIKQFRRRHRRGVVEARVGARVRHPNVAAVHDVVQHDGCHCLVMEYYGGDTLATLLRDGRGLPPPIVAALRQQLLAAVQAVHAASLVHGPVRPLVGRGDPVHRRRRPTPFPTVMPSPPSPRCSTTHQHRHGRPAVSSRSWPGCWSRTLANDRRTQAFTRCSPTPIPPHPPLQCVDGRSEAKSEPSTPATRNPGSPQRSRRAGNRARSAAGRRPSRCRTSSPGDP
jgi:hypothetical protein